MSVEKVQFPPKQPKFGGYEMPRKLIKSFVGHPSANLFLTISRAGVFQQTRLIETVDVCSAAYRGTAESSFRRSSRKFVVAGERGQNARVHFTPR